MALWGGRFAQGPEGTVFALSRSVHFDWRLAPYDLRSSMAHLAILKKSGLIPTKEAEEILKALKELSTEVASGKFVAIDSDEDVHSALERGLTEKLGAVGEPFGLVVLAMIRSLLICVFSPLITCLKSHPY
jgi:argininosuccinate lyase